MRPDAPEQEEQRQRAERPRHARRRRLGPALGIAGGIAALVVVAGAAVVVLSGDDEPSSPDQPAATTAPDETVGTSAPEETAPAGGIPTADNTGPTTPEEDLERLTPKELEERMEPGAVIEGVYVTGGDIDVKAADVTLRDFVIDAAGDRYGIVSCGAEDSDCETRDWPGGFVAEDGIIRNVGSAGLWGGGVTIRRVEVHDSGGDAFKPLDDVVIEASYGHSLGAADESHADFVQFQGDAQRVTIRGNNCALGLSTLQGTYRANACVQVNREVAAVDALVEGNWLDGGNYTANCDGPGAAGVRFERNTFGQDFNFGVNAGCPTWANNTYTDGTPA